MWTCAGMARRQSRANCAHVRKFYLSILLSTTHHLRHFPASTNGPPALYYCLLPQRNNTTAANFTTFTISACNTNTTTSQQRLDNTTTSASCNITPPLGVTPMKYTPLAAPGYTGSTTVIYHAASNNTFSTAAPSPTATPTPA
jgi:hypothetical protein